MANAEHFNILKEGPVVWNSWRKEYPYPGTIPDLCKVELPPGFNLSEFDLGRAYLRGAILNEVILCRSVLWKAGLTEAN